MSQVTRPKLLKQIHAGVVKSQLDIEYESKVELLEKMGGLLEINGQKYEVNLKDFEYLGFLGNGTCGHVMKMKHKPSGIIMVVKRKRRCNTCDVHEYQYKKMIIDLPIDLKTNDCQHIVQCFGFYFSGGLWVFMELMETSLIKLLKKCKGTIPEYILGKVTVAILKALTYLKEKHGVQHKNIKPCNIFLDTSGEVKLSDFRIPDRYLNIINTDEYTLYAAPERILLPNFPKSENYDRENVWSLGIILIELSTGVFPYRVCHTVFEAMAVILKYTPSISPHARLSPELRDFIDFCLIKDYQQRPEYDELMKHPFFQKYAKFDCKTMSILAVSGFTKLYDNWSQAFNLWKTTNKRKIESITDSTSI
ncbi:dual specificity mitogen-activated protein kinase kinase 7-like [Phymastichus coffea]|uniref:dual specificity mitogen-activated protein kinase kinase 7-like n=1 Tax=Phymastichus coffea TaxID=108790 RepID=UPI00273C409A|nr:dual specificity mitogen-activated protein kinase kinase 7-like [Phymastichus coffea]